MRDKETDTTAELVVAAVVVENKEVGGNRGVESKKIDEEIGGNREVESTRIGEENKEEG